MKRQRLALFISSFLLIALVNGFGHWATVQAQTPPSFTPAPIPIALPTAASSPTHRPADLKQSDRPSERAVSGADDRFPVLSQKFPWAAIGRIDWIDTSKNETVGTCTGTLIGRDLVLTNSHCLADEKNGNPLISRGSDPTGKLRIVFKPNLIEGNFVEADLATVIDYQYGWATGVAFSDDWALLKLNKPLGDKYGYLGWHSLNLNEVAVRGVLNNNVILAGYSRDYPSEQQSRDWGIKGGAKATAGVHLGCSIEKVLTSDSEAQTPGTAGLFVHSCDSQPGSSGSAIMAKFDDGNYYVIGLHNSDIGLPLLKSDDICELFRDRRFVKTNGCANMGVQVSRWATQALAMR